MVKDMLDVVRSFFDRKEVLLKNRKDFCAHVGTYYAKISTLLQEIADALKAGRVPESKLVELEATAEFIQPLVGATSRLVEVDRLTAMLRRSHEMALLASAPEPERAVGIRQIEASAGMFRALSEACPLHYNA